MPASSPRQEGQTAGTGIPAHVAAARTQLSNSLKDQFDPRIEKLQSRRRRPCRTAHRRSPRCTVRHGIDMTDASTVVSRTGGRPVATEYPVGERKRSSAALSLETLDEKESDGHFISIDIRRVARSDFLSVADATEVPLPPGIEVDEWSRQNAQVRPRRGPTLVDR